MSAVGLTGIQISVFFESTNIIESFALPPTCYKMKHRTFASQENGTQHESPCPKGEHESGSPTSTCGFIHGNPQILSF